MMAGYRGLDVAPDCINLELQLADEIETQQTEE